MGLFGNLFGKKDNAAAVGTQAAAVPRAQEAAQAPKGIIKTQRCIIESTPEQTKEIMELVNKNEDYKLSKKALIDEGRDGEKIFKYGLNEKAELRKIGGGTEGICIAVYVRNTHIGNIKKSAVSKVSKLIDKGSIQRVDAEVSGGDYKVLKYLSAQDRYELDELEKDFSITIEITYREEV